ncbi:hypothetical protein L6164_010100 [Bauhinia variegata]|uniref:Uncharacterized protein n=1 Tax=Bauhinia variegata TaxID=167791 RepID=A0ACB9PSG5_BAUVA|nr:hypothetical protein L6164_010100 [Bauhinia variegata]
MAISLLSNPWYHFSPTATPSLASQSPFGDPVIQSVHLVDMRGQRSKSPVFFFNWTQMRFWAAKNKREGEDYVFLSSPADHPTMVARNAMLDSKSESVVLPLVDKTVQTVDSAVASRCI